ncbi:MAG: heparinase II/III family protein [Verrucomicrobiae bacterium]|nr:heparinase II/III family protein [Verrucomicrobiae bacterium]
MRTTCFACLTGLLLLAANLPAAAPLPAAPSLPPHPRLLFTARDLPVIQERIAQQPWAQSFFHQLQARADGWLPRAIELPPRGGQWYHYYSCPKHGARLRQEGPSRHVCPVDGEVLTGYPYDDVVLMTEHNRLATAARELGIVYQITRKPAYAAKAREILLAYAAKYESYPLHDIRGEAKIGGGKVGPQTLDESTWLITLLGGADTVWSTLTDAERQQLTTGLLLPATRLIREHKMGIHNIQCWKNSAVGMTGLLLGDMALVDEALHGPSGFHAQMARGVSADGPWYENAWGYHFYTMAALAPLAEAAFHCGIPLYGPEFKRMFDAPLRLCMPDFQLPAFNDSHTVSVLQAAHLYELAWARYQDPAYAVILSRYPRQSEHALLAGRTELGPPRDFAPRSGNHPATGNAVLCAGTGTNALWLCLDYGPHGGGHGHPDKLAFVSWTLGRIQAPDPGTANYGVPIQAGWYRTTIAHNTLTVDETSQRPAEGKCEAFFATNDLAAVTAVAGDIYDGVTFRRTIALLGRQHLLFLDQVSAAREHTLDFAYYNHGQLEPPPGAQPFSPPQKPGYSYWRDTRSLTRDQGLRLRWTVGPGQTLHWVSAPAGRPLTYLTGTGVGAHTEDRVPMVVTRLQAREAALAWAVAVNTPEPPQVELLPVSNAAGQAVPGNLALAARLRDGPRTWLVVVNATGTPLRVLGQELPARLTLLTEAPGQPLRRQAEANGP